MKLNHYLIIGGISVMSFSIGSIIATRSESVAVVSPAATAILTTLAPSALADLHLAEFLTNQRADYSESESQLATPALLKAARIKGFATPEKKN